jgi:hypothetical protein
MELSIVLAVAALLIFFAVRSFQPKDAVALQQAERLRNDLRHAQMLAITWNQTLRVATAAAVPGPNCPNAPDFPARYEVRCASASAVAPCNGANPVVNPATGQAFRVNLECGFDLGAPAFTLDLDSLGRPRNGANLAAADATYTVSGGSSNRTVVVVPLTGFVTAQ